MPKDNSLKKILVIGSGPIIIGQAAEFDYSGSQALRALREEGIETILINSNPATIMTDKEMADKVYLEPLTVEFVKKIIVKERPDAILPTLGGQTGLNLALQIEREGFLTREGVRLLGVNLNTIEKAEDRQLFKELMLELGEPVPESKTVNAIDQARDFKNEVGLPLIIRPAFTLGGTGGGIAHTDEEFDRIVKSGLDNSPITQCLIERSIAGFKEVEYEIIRDKKDNCIVVCNMENIDPVGVHTGDSIVVAPSQTLSDKDHQMLRDASLKIIRALKIEGGCNVQLALDPYSFQYYVIEVNPRVSRSSALASKATGYPIAQIATKIAIGYSMDEIMNPITKNTYACFEPTLDYVVTKIPRWPFDKFHSADRTLGTQMKATGEVMGIGRTFEDSLLKCVRGLEIKRCHLELEPNKNFTTEELLAKIQVPSDERIFEVAELIRRDITIHEVYDRTKIDLWFLQKIENIIKLEKEISPENTIKALRMMGKSTGLEGLVGGQETDLKGIKRNPESLEKLYAQKSGGLYALAASMGGILYNADKKEIKALANYGKNLGIAYQFIDDVLDVIGNSNDMGKSTNMDKNKLTSVHIFGVSGAINEAKKIRNFEDTSFIFFPMIETQALIISDENSKGVFIRSYSSDNLQNKKLVSENIIKGKKNFYLYMSFFRKIIIFISIPSF